MSSDNYSNPGYDGRHYLNQHDNSTSLFNSLPIKKTTSGTEVITALNLLSYMKMNDVSFSVTKIKQIIFRILRINPKKNTVKIRLHIINSARQFLPGGVNILILLKSILLLKRTYQFIEPLFHLSFQMRS